MRIVSFEVENFRSIGHAQLGLAAATTLVGPNNEGKSNLLRALVCGMRTLSGFERQAKGLPPLRVPKNDQSFVEYQREQDLPVGLQDDPTAQTRLTFQFQLSEAERSDFRKEIGHNINQDLKIVLTFPDRKAPIFKVVKQRSGGSLGEKRDAIAAFVGRRVHVEYIPALRSAAQAASVVQRLVSTRLVDLERDPQYIKALDTIRSLQAPVLDKLSSEVGSSLQQFLPDIRTVEVRLSGERASAALRNAVEMVIDDGVATPIQQKGDGVQSLAAIALLRYAAVSRPGQKDVLIAVEEPEAHLHSRAVHQLRKVMAEIATEHQLVITTHSPLLVTLNPVSANVIVEGSQARQAQTIGQIRESLGVRLADNMQSARLVLVVEGDDDRRSLQSALPRLSNFLADALDSGDLAIEGLGGGSKLSYRLSQYTSGACDTYVFFDYDKAGQIAVENALDSGLLDISGYALARTRGKDESEFEDLIDPSVYLDALTQRFGIRLTKAEISRGRPKWSQRLKTLLEEKGKAGSKSEIVQAKGIVVDALIAFDGDPFEARYGRPLVDNLIHQLKLRLS